MCHLLFSYTGNVVKVVHDQECTLLWFPIINRQPHTKMVLPFNILALERKSVPPHSWFPVINMQLGKSVSPHFGPRRVGDIAPREAGIYKRQKQKWKWKLEMEIGNGIRKLETGNGQQMFMLQLRVFLATTCIASSPGSPIFSTHARETLKTGSGLGTRLGYNLVPRSVPGETSSTCARTYPGTRTRYPGPRRGAS